MPAEKTCPTCGKPVAEDALMGLCPDCLLRAGTGSLDSKGARGFQPPALEELARFFPELEIIELLGRGGMGAVYKARQKRLDRVVALKILPPDVGREPSFAERFEREAKALAQLHHPNIVTLYDSGQVEGLYYFFMEYVDGMTLRRLLDGGYIPPREALAIVPQICDALQFAHDRGIIHRDIKPENILLNKAGQVKIADFGVAKIVARELPGVAGGGIAPGETGRTEAGKVIGTPHYMAPEQLANPLEVDHRADIYALGVVFYQMLTGELPAGRFELPSHKVHVDVRLDEVVLRALEKKPERRYQQASIMKTQVEAIAATPTQAYAGSATAIAAGKTSTSQTAFAFIALGLFVVGLLGAILLGRDEVTSMMFGGVSLVLALIFGIVSWRRWLGRSVAIAVLLILSAFGALTYRYYAYLSPAARAEAKKEAAEARFAADQAVMPGPVPVDGVTAYRGDIGVYLDTLGQLLSPAAVSFAIPEDQAPEVVKKFEAHQPLGVDLYDHTDINKIAKGSVTAVDDQIDPSTGTLRCTAGITPEGDTLLLKGEFANVRLLLEMKRGVVLAPVSTVFGGGSNGYVYVVRPDQTVTQRHVTVGTIEAGMAEIQSGLSPGEIVVTDTGNSPGSLREGISVICKMPPNSGGQNGRSPGGSATPAPGRIEDSEKDPAVLKVELQQAAKALSALEPQYKAGIVSSQDYYAARDKVALLWAELQGDPTTIVFVKLDAAQRQLEILEPEYKAGIIPSQEYFAALDKVELLQAELHGTPVEIARITLEAAQRQLQIFEPAYKSGLVPEEDYDKAQAAVQIAQAKLDEVEATGTAQ